MIFTERAVVACRVEPGPAARRAGPGVRRPGSVPAGERGAGNTVAAAAPKRGSASSSGGHDWTVPPAFRSPGRARHGESGGFRRGGRIGDRKRQGQAALSCRPSSLRRSSWSAPRLPVPREAHGDVTRRWLVAVRAPGSGQRITPHLPSRWPGRAGSPDEAPSARRSCQPVQWTSQHEDRGRPGAGPAAVLVYALGDEPEISTRSRRCCRRWCHRRCWYRRWCCRRCCCWSRRPAWPPRRSSPTTRRRRR